LPTLLNRLLRHLRPPRKNRWCIYTSAGDRNNVAQWLSGGGQRRWDLIASYYGDTEARFAELSQRSVFCERAKGSKFQNLKRLVTARPGIFDRYSHVWVLDDDIGVTQPGIDEAFAISAANGFWVAQPVFAPEGKNSHPITIATASRPGCDFRLVNFVEVGVPIFRRDKLMEFLAVYDGKLAGAGVDSWYAHVLDANVPGHFAIIDRVRIVNPYDEWKGGSEMNRHSTPAERLAAWNETRARVGWYEFPKREFDRPT
jgi:hypothetical protein